MDNQTLVVKPNSMRNNDLFKMKNAQMHSDFGECFETKGQIFTQNTSSTVREQKILTKTIIRKKTMIINGEVVETQDEESEIQPNLTEMTKQTFYADGNGFQGKIE